MPVIPTSLTAAAGEHFVAYLLAARGYVVALTRGGSPSVDVLASDASGKYTLGIQVKTAFWGYRSRVRSPASSHWEFDVGTKAICNRSDAFIYAFVNLYGDKPVLQAKPIVFWATLTDVTQALGSGSKRNMFWVYLKDRKKYEDENWKLVETKLGRP